jgi:hypothetical protein
MTVRDTRKKTGVRVPAERSLKEPPPQTSRPRPALRREYDPAQQADEVFRTFSARWEW